MKMQTDVQKQPLAEQAEERESSVSLTPEMIDQYIEKLSQEGHVRNSLQSYRSVLRSFYRQMPEGKRLHKGSVIEWRDGMRARGRSSTTVHIQRSMINGLIRYLDRPEWQLGPDREDKPEPPPPPPSAPALSREEYLVLLRTARDSGRERAYYLIKTMGDAGINNLEMSQLTVEAVREGGAWLERFGQRRLVKIYEPLRTGLLGYAARGGVESGPVFVTRDGVPVLHSAIWRDVKRVCRQTGVPEEKGSPKCLRRLYQETYRRIQSEYMSRADEVYQQLLEDEEHSIGWDIK